MDRRQVICKVLLNPEVVNVLVRDGTRVRSGIVEHGLPVGARLVDAQVMHTMPAGALVLLFELDDESDEMREYFPYVRLVESHDDEGA